MAGSLLDHRYNRHGAYQEHDNGQWKEGFFPPPDPLHGRHEQRHGNGGHDD